MREIKHFHLWAGVVLRERGRIPLPGRRSLLSGRQEPRVQVDPEENHERSGDPSDLRMRALRVRAVHEFGAVLWLRDDLLLAGVPRAGRPALWGVFRDHVRAAHDVSVPPSAPRAVPDTGESVCHMKAGERVT